MGIIYQCTNLVNNKVYIGQTIRTLEERKKEHLKKENRPWLIMSIIPMAIPIVGLILNLIGE